MERKMWMKRKEGIGRKLLKGKWCYLGLLPTFLLLIVFQLYPAVDSLYRSLSRWKTSNYFSPEFDGLANYVRLAADREFFSSFGVLFVFILVGFITTFAVNMPVTYLVYRLGAGRLGRFFQRAFVIPMMVPAMVLTMYWKFFFSNRDGILNTILEYLGRQEWCRIWLADHDLTLWCLQLIGFPFIGGFSFLILLSGFLNIDASLGEAAQLDGATAWDKFIRIDVPLIIPQMKILSILGMIAGVQAFSTQMIMTNGRYGTMVPGLLMYQTAFTKGNYGYASAMGVVLFAVILVLTIIQNKYVKNADA